MVYSDLIMHHRWSTDVWYSVCASNRIDRNFPLSRGCVLLPERRALCLFWTVSAIYQLEDSLTSMRNHIRSFLSTARSLCNDMYVLGHGSVEKCTNRLKKRLPRRRKATLTYTLTNRLQDGRATNNTAKTKQSWQWFSRVSSDYIYIYIDSAVHEATHYQFGEKESLERDSC